MPVIEPDLPPPPVRRRRVWLALAVSAIAIPILVLDNLDEGDDTSPVDDVRVVVPAVAPDDRPDAGPAKGVSVVTSSTTSSTVPLTTTTTTTTTIPG